MGNAMDFIEQKMREESEKKKEAAKKAKNVTPRRKETTYQTTVVKTCACCETRFTDVVKTVKNRMYGSSYCKDCSGPKHFRKRKMVESAGSWSRYKALKSAYSKKLSGLTIDELYEQRACRIGLDMSTKDTDRAIQKMKEVDDA